ncbi:MAG: conjugal transfer protein TraK [Muricauda sp.]|nr:conjugal transfer protein TraK [uncultured Allomuricauda sp.]MAO16793.1 conjugal transfer protein TraK [Allomuricauda sp.]MBC73996.1 conjugal transfer protein TraK [Allomuricauda sp.]|tara:strand:- start:6075 stop:6701 length:627 start_codon:yes stop_codon:yes gene_type:complete
MKTPFKNIQYHLRLNRWVVLSVISTSGLVSILSLVMVFQMHRDVLDHAFVVNGQGEVIPLSWADQRENREVEALAQLEQFHQWFYGVDAGSYQRNMERALWLGNASVANVFQQKRADGFYNRLLQYSLVQKVVRVDSKIDMGQKGYRFQCRIMIEVHRGKVTDSYELFTSGQLVEVERRFPHNPHGLLITDFFENSLRKMENHEATEK